MMAAAIRSTDLERSIAFYTETLGMVVRGRVDRGDLSEVMLAFAGRENSPGIMLFKHLDSASSVAVDHGNTEAKIIIDTPDAAAIVQRMTARGDKMEAIQTVGPYRILVAYDPDGYTLEIVQRPR